jgi:hypothetical protein
MPVSGAWHNAASARVAVELRMVMESTPQQMKNSPHPEKNSGCGELLFPWRDLVAVIDGIHNVTVG